MATSCAPSSPSIPGWVMSWKEGIFSLCSVGPWWSLSVSSESRKPLRAFARSCHVTPLAKGNVNGRTCSEATRRLLRRSRPDSRTLPTTSSPLTHSKAFVHRHGGAAPWLWISRDKREFLTELVEHLGLFSQWPSKRHFLWYRQTSNNKLNFSSLFVLLNLP